MPSQLDVKTNLFTLHEAAHMLTRNPEDEATGAFVLRGRNNAPIVRLAAMVETLVARFGIVVRFGFKRMRAYAEQSIEKCKQK